MLPENAVRRMATSGTEKRARDRMTDLFKVTFLFTEMEDSTVLWESYPVQMKAALKRYGEILRGVVEDRSDHVFGMIGEACYAAFDDPEQALRAALVAQTTLFAEEWVSPINLRVRMALHTEVSPVSTCTRSRAR
jgi:class 3 adenylate cyclase